MFSLGEYRKGQAGLVFILLILVLVLFLGILYIGLSNVVVNNYEKDNSIPLEVVDVDSLVGLTRDNLNLEGIEVRRIDTDFISSSSRGSSSRGRSSSSSSADSEGSSSPGFSSGGGDNRSDKIAPIITNISRNPSGGLLDNGSGQNIDVIFESNEFPINVTFELQNSSGNVVNILQIGIINSSSNLPVDYVLPSGLDEGIYDIFMIISDESGNGNDYFIGRIFVDFDSFACGENQRILKLDSLTNSHVELYNVGNYGVDICYDSLFGVPYEVDDDLSSVNPGDERICDGSNGVLSLFSDSNSHVSEFNTPGYNVDICYGDLVCELRDNSCLAGEVKILGVYSEDNSHVEVAGLNNYFGNLCCSSAFAN